MSRIFLKAAFVLVTLTYCFAVSPKIGTRGKRLILHNDMDVAIVLQNLTSTVRGLESSLQTANAKILSLENQLAKRQVSESVSTYVRWGRNTCPGNGSELVYWGFAGGDHYAHSGSGANYVCLTSDPTWGVYDDRLQDGGLMYGTEYHYTEWGRHLKQPSVVFEDATCAVCRVQRSTTIMIPGRNVCYPGWSLEYAGYLSSGRYQDAGPTEYICVDLKPDVLYGGHPKSDGRLINYVEGRCGSLKCPPYVDGRELTCAVCSK